MSDEDVVKAVRYRYRVCNYLLVLGLTWNLAGLILRPLLSSAGVDSQSGLLSFQITGGGILAAAFAVTLAMYRCPVCDHYLSRFRSRKDQCGNCGAKVR